MEELKQLSSQKRKGITPEKEYNQSTLLASAVKITYLLQTRVMDFTKIVMLLLRTLGGEAVEGEI